MNKITQKILDLLFAFAAGCILSAMFMGAISLILLFMDAVIEMYSKAQLAVIVIVVALNGLILAAAEAWSWRKR